MTTISIDAFRTITSTRGFADLDARLPSKNSLRRAGDSSKAAVAAATEALRAGRLEPSDRVGVYVGEQQVALDYCAQFIEATYAAGPRLAGPMLFSESVANNAATHLSLTLGFTGPLQTFIGSRAAGIAAVAAAREDLAAGAVEAALVVVLSFGHPLTAQAFAQLYYPGRSAEKRPDLPFLNGAAAFLVRRGTGEAELQAARTSCAGLDPREQERAVRGLLGSSGVTSAASSTFRFARELSLGVLRRAGLSVEPPIDVGGEAFALDPFLQIEKGLRRVVVLGEDGTAGVIALG